MTGSASALRWGLCVAWLAASAGCAAKAGYEVTIASGGSRAILQVTNRGLDPVQLSLVRSGASIPVGSVPGLGTRTFYLTASQLGNGGALQLKAGPRADVSAFQSAVFSATVGQRIEWVINHTLASDVVIVR